MRMGAGTRASGRDEEDDVTFSDIRHIDSPTGARLAYRHLRAEDTPRGILLVCLGMIEHSGRYGDFATAMAARGYHVYAHDHRGHGETTAPDAPLGRFARKGGADLVLRDVLAMRDLAVTANPDLPVALFGHSMGGLIALNTALAHPSAFAALAIWNSNFDAGLSGRVARIVLAAERMLKGSDVPSLILPKATFEAWGRSIPDRRTEYDWLSTDPAVVDRYIADPLCRFLASVSMWEDVLDLVQRPLRGDTLKALPATLPIHLTGGRLDPATRGGKAVEALANRMRQAGLSRVTLRIHDTMRHETLNEIGREDATAEFATWLDGALEARV